MTEVLTHLLTLRFKQRFRLPRFPELGIFEVIEGLEILEGEKEPRLQVLTQDGRTITTREAAFLNDGSYFVLVIHTEGRS